MDCSYIQQNEIHEKYLLNRLAEAEKAEYEKHIEDCTLCQKELEKQRTIIEGIREIGFQEMKNEIHQQVALVKAERKSVDWQMVLKVAAVLFMIAIIPSAIYYFQTEPGKPISQLLKSERSMPESRSFAYDEAQVEDKSKTREEKAEPTPKSAAPLEKPVTKEKQAETKMHIEDQLTISSDVATGKAGRGYAAAEMKSIKETSNSESILEEHEADIEQSQSLIAAKAEKDKLLQKLSAGATYHFIGSDFKKEKVPHFETQETTTPQKSDAVRSKKLPPNSNLMENEVGGNDSELPVISSAVYETDGKRITIYFLNTNRKLKIDKESKLPQSFEVQITNRDSLNWKMSWFVNPEFLEYDPQQMKIVFNKIKIYSIILDAYIYEININTNSTTAILVR